MTRFVSLRSARAPYIRGGVSFHSTRESVVIEASMLTEEQAKKLHADPVITVTVFDKEDPGAPAASEDAQTAADRKAAKAKSADAQS